MIRPEDVADLRPGDVVELRDDLWPPDNVVRGTVHYSQIPGVTDDLCVGPQILRRGSDGGTPQPATRTLTVLSRPPRLYVNHDRTEPAPGDVAVGGPDSTVYSYRPVRGPDIYDWWFWDATHLAWNHGDAPVRLRLLVDGETGQVVP